MKDFEEAISDRCLKEAELMGKYYDKELNTFAKYCEHRHATIQIEYCHEILKVSLGCPVISTRAGLRYAELIGIAKGD